MAKDDDESSESSASGSDDAENPLNEDASFEHNPLPSKIMLVAGTYDGVLAAWELNAKNKLAISLAAPVHDGSIRSLSIAAAVNQKNDGEKTFFESPGVLLSCGYDEMLKTHDFQKRLQSSGEIRTPADYGTPICSAFAPPTPLTITKKATASAILPSTHCLVGFSGGKLVIYKKRDWSLQHVLAGHDGGVSCLAVHPSGKLALSGGTSDGKLKLWDLTKGRLAFVTKINPATSAVQGRKHYDSVVSIVWSPNNTDDSNTDAYAVAYGSHITVRAADTGKDLLDVELPSRVNQICFLKDPSSDALYVAAACNDGSLPVLAVHGGSGLERPAIMAIEPVDSHIAKEERFKCIVALSGYYIATCNSAGVVSLMNLQGAIKMITLNATGNAVEAPSNSSAGVKDGEETPVNPESDSDDSDDEDQELAVDIIDSVQLGSGARITCLSAWCSHAGMEETLVSDDEEESPGLQPETRIEEEKEVPKGVELEKSQKQKRKRDDFPDNKRVTMGKEQLENARALVDKAKKIQERSERKKHRKESSR